MKELTFLNIIKKSLSNPSFLGDDCAYLKDLGILMTQDSLVEDVHFKLDTTNPYLLGYKCIAVNLSDLASNCAGFSGLKYVTIALCLPHYCDENFVEQFYKGVNDICEKYGVIVAGGDICASDKLVVSVCAVSTVAKPEFGVIPSFPSRKNAKIGDIVLTTGNHGSSACGLWLLQNGKKLKQSENLLKKIINKFLQKFIRNSSDSIIQNLILTHLKPEPKFINVRTNCAMDTSDGLCDALFKIATDSNVSMKIDFEKIPYDKNIEKFNPDFKNWIFWGGEDYEIVFTISEEEYSKIDKSKFFKIGEVIQKNCCSVKIYDKSFTGGFYPIDEDVFNSKSFNHFNNLKGQR